MGEATYQIRKAEMSDMPAVFALVKALASFEKAEDQVETSAAQYQTDGFGSRPAFECFVAEQEEQIIGIALFYFGYSTWKGKLVYLDDLIVKEGYRRMGIGRKLIDHMLVYAREQGARMAKWQVLDWNESAIEMYKSLGATFDQEWIDVKIYDDQLKDWSV